MGLHVEVKKLPIPVQEALLSLKYHRRDIEIEPSETVSPFVGGGDGFRGFFTVVDLPTHRHETIWGSWGGANPWSSPKATAVDQDSKERPIPEDQVFIKGEKGGTQRSTYATVYIHSSRFTPLLSALSPKLSSRETLIFAIFTQVRGGQRKEYLVNHNVAQGEIDSLVAKGLLAKSKSAAVSVTLLGKNVPLPKGYYVPSYPK